MSFLSLGKEFFIPSRSEGETLQGVRIDGHRVLKAIVECRENTQCIAVVEHNDNIQSLKASFTNSSPFWSTIQLIWHEGMLLASVAVLAGFCKYQVSGRAIRSDIKVTPLLTSVGFIHLSRSLAETVVMLAFLRIEPRAVAQFVPDDNTRPVLHDTTTDTWWWFMTGLWMYASRLCATTAQIHDTSKTQHLGLQKKAPFDSLVHSNPIHIQKLTIFSVLNPGRWWIVEDEYCDPVDRPSPSHRLRSEQSRDCQKKRSCWER